MRKLFLLLALALLTFPISAFAQADTDGDGVDDLVDLCPAEDASYFDVDGDGCVDATANTRHMEFWTADSLPLVYEVHEPAAGGIFDGSDFAAILAGFEHWTTLPNVVLSVGYGGTTPNPNADGMDGVNTITFEDADFLAMYGSAVLAVGVTTSLTVPGDFLGTPVRPGQIVDADMIFNPIRLFSTDTAGSGPDLESVVTHEAGHLFGFGHSGVVTSTMFPALPAGINARTLEIEDQVLAFMGYPEPGALANSTSLAGTLADGTSLDPIGGAAVFAISTVTGDTLGAQYTFADGSFRFTGLPEGDYFVSVSPLDGSATNGVVPGLVNDYINGIATNLLWDPEYWDLAESADDGNASKDPVTLSIGSPVTGIDIITNVDSVPPVLQTVAPDGATLVRADAVFFIEFDEPVDFDSAADVVRLRQDITGTFVNVPFGLLQVNNPNVLIVDPAGLMAYDTDFELVIGAGLQDRFGNPTPASTTVAFTTELAPPLTISTVSPSLASGGVVAVIYGSGFDLTNPSNNLVNFGTTQVPASTSGSNSLTVQVPVDLPIGAVPLSVTKLGTTSNTIQITGVESSDFVRGTDYASIPLSADPEAVALLPDAQFSYVATGDGVVAVTSGFGNPNFSATTLIPFAAGTNDLAVSPDGHRVYAVSRDAQRIIVINSDYGNLTSPNPTFNTILDELETVGSPVGIALDPAGERAYVATSSGRVEVWDIELGSGTYHRPVAVLESPTPSLQGSVAVDRTGLRVLALTGTGELLIWDASNPAVAPIVSPVTMDPRDITIDPAGVVAYVTDGTGTISVVLLSNGLVSQTISVEGEPYALALTPSGLRGYVANRAGDNLPAVDFDPASSSFRTVTNALPAGQQPVDVAASPDADYLLVAEQGGPVLRIVGLRYGPEITSVQPQWARGGDVITVNGSDFAVQYPGQMSASTTHVYIGGEEASLTHANSHTLWAKVPEGFTGGTVVVGVEGAAIPGVPPLLLSNPASLRYLPGTTSLTDDPSNSVFLYDENGYLWNQNDGGVEATVATSPDGRFMIMVSLANIAYLVDADRTSPTRGEIIGSIPLENAPKPGKMVVQPDGRRAFYSGLDGEVHILNTDPEDSEYLTETGTIYWTSNDPGSGDANCLAITPSGDFLVFSDDLNGILVLAHLTNRFESLYQTTDFSNQVGIINALAIHPTGLAMYAASTGGTLYAYSLDRQSGFFFGETESSTNFVNPQDVACTPDGQRLFVLDRGIGPTGNHQITDMDVSSPFAPFQYRDPQIFQLGTQQDPPGRMFLSPTGDRMIVDLAADGITSWLDVSLEGNPTSVFTDLGSLVINGTSSQVSVAFVPDGSGFFSASRGDTGIHFADLVLSEKFDAISGQTQVGVAGEPLSAPLVYSITDGQEHPATGAVAQVQVTGGGGTLGNGADYQWVTVDEHGQIKIDWTMGPVADVGPPTNQLTISLNNETTQIGPVTIASVSDPSMQPLAQVQVLPTDVATAVSLTSTAQVVFSRAISPAAITPASLTLRRQSDGAPVAVAYGFSAGNSRVSIIPVVGLEPTTTYEIVSTAAIADPAGGLLTNPTTTTFTTQDPPPLSISAVSPPAATVGTQIVISGAGFAAVAANNVVHFGPKNATASTVGAGFITVFVPLGAATGDLTVTANLQTSNGRLFTVLVPETAPLDEVFATVGTGISVQSVAVTPDGSKAYTVSTETNQVLPIDLSTFTTLAAIPVGNAPQGVVLHPNGQTAYVTNFGSGTVSVIDTGLDTVIATIEVGTNPVELVASPVGDRLYVVNQLDQTLSVIDIDVTSSGYNTVVATAPTSRTTHGAAIRPDGTVLYLGTSDGFLTIQLTPLNFGVVATVPTSKSTKGAAITPDGSLLLLVTTTNEVLIVDVSVGGSNAVVATVPTSKNTKGAAITPDGSLLYLLQEDTDEVLVIALNIGTSVGVTGVGLGPIVVHPTVVKSIPVDPSPGVIAFDPSGSGLAIIAHQRSSGQLSFLNTSSIPRGDVTAIVHVYENEIYADELYRGFYIDVCVEFSGAIDPHAVDLSTVRLNGVLEPVAAVTDFADCDGNGIEELRLRFDRRALREFLPVASSVDVIITGEVGATAEIFAGSQTISTVWPVVTAPIEDAILVGGYPSVLTWETPPGLDVGCVDIWWTANGGEYWAEIASELPNTGEYQWIVPAIFSPNSIVEVSFYDQCADLQTRQRVGIALSANFAVKDRAVPVVMQGVDLGVSDGAGHLEWTATNTGSLSGFQVYRSESREGSYRQVTSTAVQPVGSLEGLKFVYEDDTIFANRDYYYLLQEVREDGSSFQHGPYQLKWTLENALFQNRPNTFNPRTTISFDLAQDGRARLAVYDLRGRLVDVLVDEVLRAENHEYIWDGTDRGGQSVASGVYIYRLTTSDGFAASKKMTLVR